MTLRTLGYATLLALTMGVAVACAKPVDRETAPPDPVYEVDPGARPGYVWSGGCWVWDGKNYTWKSGHWVADRPGYTWIPDTWNRHGKQWRYTEGHWEQDPDAVPVVQDKAEPAAADNVSEEDAAEPTASTPAKAMKGKAKSRHAAAPKADYSNTKLWPRVVQH